MIFLYTDFGTTGPYVGQMKARLFHYAPNVPVIDLMHDAPAFDIGVNASLFAGVIDCLPKKSVFLAIVDPGVGSSRRPICLKVDDIWFVGPDNGLFSQIIAKADDVKAYEILWRGDETSISFHGRDLFAPVAAMIATGTDFPKKEIEVDSLVAAKKEIESNQIIYIDAYGNLWSDLREKDVCDQSEVIICGQSVTQAKVFSSVPAGSLFWYINSSGFVEIACNQGSAASVLKASIGAPVRLNSTLKI